MKRLTTNTKENLNANRKNVLLTGYKVGNESYRVTDQIIKSILKDVDIWYIDDEPNPSEIERMNLVVHMSIWSSDVVSDSPDFCNEVTDIAKKCGIPIIAAADGLAERWCGCEFPCGEKNIYVPDYDCGHPESSLLARTVKAVLYKESDDPVDKALRAFINGDEEASELMVSTGEQGDINKMMIAARFLAMMGRHKEMSAILKKILGYISTADFDRCMSIVNLTTIITSHIWKNRREEIDDSDIETIRMIMQKRTELSKRMAEIEERDQSGFMTIVLNQANANDSSKLECAYLLRSLKTARELPVNFITVDTIVMAYRNVFLRSDSSFITGFAPEELTEELRTRLEESGYMESGGSEWRRMLLRTAEIHEEYGRYKKAIEYYRIGCRLLSKLSDKISTEKVEKITQSIDRLEKKLVVKPGSKAHHFEEAFRLLQENK